METRETQNEGAQRPDGAPPASQTPEEGFMLPQAESEEEASKIAQSEKDEEVEEDRPGGTRDNLVPTVVVGVLMFLIGALTGFVSRPIVMPPPIPPAPTLSAAQQQQQAGMQAILAKLIPMTRHFEGNANAPVTMLEFADFQ
jgi:protein-disulfide isomerase